MRVFVTGASGFVGSAVVKELIAAGHQVVGLARSDSAAATVASLGAQVQRGSLDELESLQSGAAASDGVIHTAFIHDFSNYAYSAQADRRAIETIGAVLAGSGRPLVVTAGLGGFSGGLITEEDVPGDKVPRFSEVAGLQLASQGVRAAVVRLPPTVHGEGDHGFIPTLINIARSKGVSAYPGDGSNHWPAVHRLDAARLFRLALEKAPAGARLHGIAEEGVPVREIASMIGHHLGIPTVSVPAEKVSEHFGWLGMFFAMDLQASSKLTQQRLGWQPTEPSLLADLAQDYYYNS